MHQDDLFERYADRVAAEQVALVYATFQQRFWLLLLAPPVIVPVMWGHVAHLPLLLWALAYSVSVIERRFLARRYVAASPSTQEARRWGLRFTVRAAVAAALIGSTGFWMFTPDSEPHLLFLLAYLSLISAGAAAFYGPLQSAYNVFLPLVTLPLGLKLLLVGTTTAAATAFAVVLYTLFLLQVGRDYSLAIGRSFALRFQNLDLLRELTEKKEEAERANRAKSQFLAAASHDLRQPLQALALLTGTLRMNALDSQRELTERIGASVEALESLFSALLDISRLDAQVIRPERRPVHLADLLERIGREAAAAAEAKGLRLRVHPSPHWGESDPVLLLRIVQNLVANAIRYTERGGVLIGVRARGSALRLEVRDSGRGISSDHQERVFEEYFQVGNPERDRRKGLGLGLAIVRRLAELLGHGIEVKSRLGRGSVFAVTLPRAAPPPEHAAQARVAVARPAFEGLAVLVIEDDAEVRGAIALALRSWGCDALVAADEEEALAQATIRGGWRPQIVLSDYRLRGGRQGIELAHGLLLRWGLKVPVVLLTGDTGIGPREEARLRGFRLLTKPVSLAHLETLLRELTACE
jgi:signal transduction histidine kinase/CheY-like chemotaxis protein